MSHLFQDVKKVGLHLITRLYPVPVFCSQDDDDGAVISGDDEERRMMTMILEVMTMILEVVAVALEVVVVALGGDHLPLVQ